MSSNFPNMSYCMCNNTLAGLEQILDHMDAEGDVNFLRDLNPDEMRAFDELIHVAQLFHRRADKAQGQLIDENVAAVLDRE
jgi:hypothetical protein